MFAKSDSALLIVAHGSTMNLDSSALLCFWREVSHVQKTDYLVQEKPRRALKVWLVAHLRIGIHCGPVSSVTDVNDRLNVAGAGINIAQRVMDCGDAGHILVSRRMADELAQHSEWHPYLHDLGEVEVKHGVRVALANFFGDGFGNSKSPAKIIRAKQIRRRRLLLWLSAALLFLLSLPIGSWIWARRAALTTAYKIGAADISEKSIAVLPFENLNDQKEDSVFADGVQDDILTKLAKIADLKVISRTSVMDYRGKRNVREIGTVLRVSHVLEGSIRRVGTHLHLNTQLIDTRTDTHVWVEQYDRNLNDLFAIQSEIAQKIVGQLRARISPAEKLAIERKPTGDLVAFELYSRAISLPPLSRTGSFADAQQSIDLLNQAVARDPSFLEAYCALALSHDQIYFFGLDHTPARLASAEAAIQEAFRIRPNAGEAHLARARHLYNGYLDYDGALAELEVARQRLPNDPRIFRLTGSIQRRQGHWEECIRYLERALELDPRNRNTLESLGDTYASLRRYAEQKSNFDRILAIEPNDVAAKAERAFVEVNWKADTGPLRQLIDDIRATNPAAMPQIADRWLTCALAERDLAAAREALLAFDEGPLGVDAVLFPRAFVEGTIARMANDEHKAQLAVNAARAEQEKIVLAQPDYGPAWCVLGVIDAALGRKEDALREGRRAVELLPVERESVNGLHMIEYLAMIAAWVGEKDLACEQLAKAIRYPIYPSTISYGELKLMPCWDPLRGEQCFEKIVASLAPK